MTDQTQLGDWSKPAPVRIIRRIQRKAQAVVEDGDRDE
jgi:hypothetical protein